MDIENIKKEALDKLENIKDSVDLESFKRDYLSKKGKIRDLFSLVKDLPIEEKKTLGQKINQLAQEIEEVFLLKEKDFIKEKKEEIDLTLPAKPTDLGSLHPITQIRREMERIFQLMGFSVVEGPEIEDEWHNFDALNIPEGHPARDALSLGKTFYLKGGNVLRTQTSSAQVRYMKKMKPPIRIIVPGKVYRYETTDASHETNFFQLEGLLIDENVSVANLKAVLKKFLEEFFKREVEIRLRPSYFPFTEPSFEVDMLCTVCDGKGCAACKRTGWVEILGAGMVHPNVIKNGGLDPKKYKGFAFGLSIDRPTMMKYKINDIRLFHSGNLNFLKQF
ncbi:MAG: phenylalanine--tRNA ligase subunit alpha [Candidatus Pacebacteria bacterium]|nr:phenylalanine--tRNA ligase subunit alpha [Candidatus Paceibacterota bacterium]MDD2757064.1 phenylalanine--tRNA ligase subunit alpha [Candidatus Paceibacterota bacterium]MDD3283684.1 phenylalanine--tRNA ligase subunit alpha [Candidatus Paceibacterota bacterium]MDD3969841.1 phenylalanine--tRNA ligase subunit alpha [Candidatus Paceibacterota bacterium]MDD4737747.1 phenylalanine--tRNA ligase subunit alpha [Candidatus Paceibacterota bacterium]